MLFLEKKKPRLLIEAFWVCHGEHAIELLMIALS